MQVMQAVLLPEKNLYITVTSEALEQTIKIIYTGGFRETPIDLVASNRNGYTKYIESEAFTRILLTSEPTSG
jgi:hypothetical protein